MAYITHSLSVAGQKEKEKKQQQKQQQQFAIAQQQAKTLAQARLPPPQKRPSSSSVGVSSTLPAFPGSSRSEPPSFGASSLTAQKRSSGSGSLFAVVAHSTPSSGAAAAAAVVRSRSRVSGDGPLQPHSPVEPSPRRSPSRRRSVGASRPVGSALSSVFHDDDDDSPIKPTTSSSVDRIIPSLATSGPKVRPSLSRGHNEDDEEEDEEETGRTGSGDVGREKKRSRHPLPPQSHLSHTLTEDPSTASGTPKGPVASKVRRGEVEPAKDEAQSDAPPIDVTVGAELVAKDCTGVWLPAKVVVCIAPCHYLSFCWFYLRACTINVHTHARTRTRTGARSSALIDSRLRDLRSFECNGAHRSHAR
jgi:hypothetical protein